MAPAFGRRIGLGHTMWRSVGLLPAGRDAGPLVFCFPLSVRSGQFSTNLWIRRANRRFRKISDRNLFRSRICESRPEERGAIEYTETAYRFDVVTEIPYFPLGVTPRKVTSYIWVQIQSYSSRAILSRVDSFCLGDFVSVLPIAIYGGTGRASLDAWGLGLFRVGIEDTGEETGPVRV